MLIGTVGNIVGGLFGGRPGGQILGMLGIEGAETTASGIRGIIISIIGGSSWRTINGGCWNYLIYERS
jgi:hypothetical protein